MNPCGLRSWSYFNDTFALGADEPTCGADSAAAAGSPQAAGSSGSSSSSRLVPLALDEQGISWGVESSQLYADYNATNHNTVPALRGGGALAGPVGEDGHFVVWMRPSARPTSHKAYALLHRR